MLKQQKTFKREIKELGEKHKALVNKVLNACKKETEQLGDGWFLVGKTERHYGRRAINSGIRELEIKPLRCRNILKVRKISTRRPDNSVLDELCIKLNASHEELISYVSANQ